MNAEHGPDSEPPASEPMAIDEFFDLPFYDDRRARQWSALHEGEGDDA